MAKVITNYNLTIPTLIGGQNKDCYDMVQFWVNAGFFKTDDTAYPQLDPRNGPTLVHPDDWHVDLDAVFLWCDQGADIEDYQGAYHELADPNKVCPYDPEGLQTWMEYGVVGDSHKPVQIGAFWYRSMLMGTQGTPLNCQEWYDYIRQPGTNTTGIQRIISLFDFQEIQAANTP